jgi:hypothetical protein
MLKNYANKFSTYGGYAVNSKVHETVKDIDERLNRLEQLTRKHILEPAGVEVGTSLAKACDKVEKAARAVGALAEEVGATPKFPQTKVGMRQEIARLRRHVDILNIGLDAANTKRAELETQLARAKDDYWREKIARTGERNDLVAKVRQFAKETIGA